MRGNILSNLIFAFYAHIIHWIKIFMILNLNNILRIITILLDLYWYTYSFSMYIIWKCNWKLNMILHHNKTIDYSRNNKKKFKKNWGVP
jgi:hypothetical protein